MVISPYIHGKMMQGKKLFGIRLLTILAQALEELYPGVKLSIGPAIDNGFYYDVDLGDQVISDKDFKSIEDKMIEIARGKHEFSIKSVSKQTRFQNIKMKTMHIRLN